MKLNAGGSNVRISPKRAVTMAERNVFRVILNPNFDGQFYHNEFCAFCRFSRGGGGGDHNAGTERPPRSTEYFPGHYRDSLRWNTWVFCSLAICIFSHICITLLTKTNQLVPLHLRVCRKRAINKRLMDHVTESVSWKIVGKKPWRFVRGEKQWIKAPRVAQGSLLRIFWLTRIPLYEGSAPFFLYVARDTKDMISKFRTLTFRSVDW